MSQASAHFAAFTMRSVVLGVDTSRVSAFSWMRVESHWTNLDSARQSGHLKLEEIDQAGNGFLQVPHVRT
jgi:hypothetical protein